MVHKKFVAGRTWESCGGKQLIVSHCSSHSVCTLILWLFHPECRSSSAAFRFSIPISRSLDWGVEEGVMEEELCTEGDLVVDVAGTQLETTARVGGWWQLCWEEGRTSEGWRRMGDKWVEEGAALKSGKGANGRGRCHLTDNGGNCAATCRWAKRDGCRLDSERPGRTCSVWSLCTSPATQTNKVVGWCLI